MQFEFEAAGDKLVARRLLRYADRAVAAKPAFDAIADTLRGYEKRLFDSQGASGGARWDDLAQTTIDRKASAKQDPRVLHATLALRKSLTEKDDPEHEEYTTDSYLLFGSKLSYAGYHQRGRGVKTRKPIQFGENQKKYILKKLQRWIATGEV